MINPNVKRHISSFLSILKDEKEYSETTIKAYDDELHYLFRLLEEHVLSDANYHLKDITKKDIRNLLKYLKYEKENSAVTRARKISSLSSFFKFLVREEIVDSNVMNKIYKPNIPERVVKIPSKTQIRRFFDQLNSRGYRNEFEKKTFKIFFVLKYNTMARISEMLEIKVKDIDFERHDILLKGKGGVERVIPLSEKMIGMLRDYIEFAELSKEDALIRNRFNEPAKIRSLHDRVQTIREEAGLEDWISSHPLCRKAPAQKLLKSGFDLEEVQDILGHKDPKTTRIYVEAVQDDIRKKMEDVSPFEDTISWLRG